MDGWGAGDNKKSLLRSSLNPQDFYDPSAYYPLAVDGWGAGDKKSVCCEAALVSETFMTPGIAFGSLPSSI